MIKHGVTTICRALSAANKLYLTRDDDECKVSIKRPAFISAPLSANALSPTKEDPKDKTVPVNKSTTKEFPKLVTPGNKSPAKVLFESSSESAVPKSPHSFTKESTEDGSKAETVSEKDLPQPLADQDLLQPSSPDVSHSSESDVDVGTNTPLQLSAPTTPQYSPSFPLDLSVRRSDEMSSGKSSPGEYPLSSEGQTHTEGQQSQSEPESTQILPIMPTPTPQLNVESVSNGAPGPSTGSIMPKIQGTANTETNFKLKDTFFAGTSSEFKQKYENDSQLRISTLYAGMKFFEAISENMDQTFFMKVERITEEPYVKVTTSTTFEGMPDYTECQKEHPKEVSTNPTGSQQSQHLQLDNEIAHNVHDFEIMDPIGGEPQGVDSDSTNPNANNEILEIPEYAGVTTSTSGSIPTERKGEKRNPEESPIGQKATKAAKVVEHVENDEVPGTSTVDQTTRRRMYKTKLTSKMKLSPSDSKFLDLYVKSLKLGKLELPNEPNLLAASGVLLELIAARGIEMFGSNPDTPIQFVIRICSLATQDPPPDWNKLFHQTDKNVVKSEWAKILGEDAPFDKKEVRDALLENIALAFTATSRKNLTHSSYYFQKLSFCIGILVIGSFKAVGKECPIEFTPNDLTFWRYLGPPDAEANFDQANGWKIPTIIDITLETENQDQEWELVTSWLKKKNNFRVFYMEEEIERMTGSGHLSKFYQKSRKEEALRKQAYHKAGKILPREIKEDKARITKRKVQEKKRQQKKTLKKEKVEKKEDDPEFENFETIEEVVEGVEGVPQGDQNNGQDKEETPAPRRSTRNKK